MCEHIPQREAPTAILRVATCELVAREGNGRVSGGLDFRCRRGRDDRPDGEGSEQWKEHGLRHARHLLTKTALLAPCRLFSSAANFLHTHHLRITYYEPTHLPNHPNPKFNAPHTTHTHTPAYFSAPASDPLLNLCIYLRPRTSKLTPAPSTKQRHLRHLGSP